MGVSLASGALGSGTYTIEGSGAAGADRRGTARYAAASVANNAPTDA